MCVCVCECSRVCVSLSLEEVLIVCFFKVSCHLLLRNALFLVLRELSNPDMVGGPDGASAEEEDLEWIVILSSLQTTAAALRH